MELLIRRITALLPECNARRIRTILEALRAGVAPDQIKAPRETVNDVIMCGRFISIHAFGNESDADLALKRNRVVLEGEELVAFVRRLLENQADA